MHVLRVGTRTVTSLADVTTICFLGDRRAVNEVTYARNTLSNINSSVNCQMEMNANS